MPAYYLEALTVTLGLILLVAEAFVPSKSKAWLGVTAAAGLVVILGLCFIAVGPDLLYGTVDVSSGGHTFSIHTPLHLENTWRGWPLWNFYQFDSMALFYKGFALVTTIFVLLMAVDFRKILARFTDHAESENGTGEYYSLPIFACAGMMWLASAKDLAGAFVALELVTVTFYILVAYMRRNVGSLEAGVKYLILGALSTGFLVYGIAWVYGTTHTLSFTEMPSAISHIQSPMPLLFGVALVMVGLGFKIGAVPMQFWIPDVYQGAPTPTTAFLSVGSKAAGFILRCHPRSRSQFVDDPRRRNTALRKPRGDFTNEFQTPARLFIDRPCRIPSAGLSHWEIRNRELTELIRRGFILPRHLPDHDTRRVLHPRSSARPTRWRRDLRLQWSRQI
jgi:NADH-quinone oxidoreductase subunit N